MRVAICLVATVLISGPRNQDPTVKGYVPPNGFVPDSGTAVRNPVSVWIPIYGASQIRSEQPYCAILKDGAWTVTGTLPLQCNQGGAALSRISTRDRRMPFGL